MSRTPPRHSTRGSERGPVQTKHLPDRSDAKRTWTGSPADRSAGRWSGTLDFGGRKYHVGTFDTPRQWGEARDKLLVELREQAMKGGSRRPSATELDGVTIAEFVSPAGRYHWPWRFTRKGLRSQPGTFEHHAQCIRPFVAHFGDRRIKDGITRFEASQWADTATENQITSAIALINDARDLDPSFVNPLEKMSRKRTRGRKDLPDVLTAAEVETLKRLALMIHNDGWGLVLEAMIELMATSAPRPGEIWAMERAELNVARREINIEQAVKKAGRLGPPKYDQRRPCVIAPSAWALIMALDVTDPVWFFPAKHGGLIYESKWTTYWHPVRDAFAAGLPEHHWLPRRIAKAARALAKIKDPTLRRRLSNGKLDFYELRHRGITYMGTPRRHGLGLASPDIAYQVGHRDGGRLIEEIYMHRNPELARDRIRAAMGYPDEDLTSGEV